MQPSEYAAQFEDISTKLAELREKAAQSDYCEKTPYAEFMRDVSIALELRQREVDLFSEIMDDSDAIGEFDPKYFMEFCKRYDERHGQ